MKKVLMLAALLLSLTAQAQESVLQKYKKMGDVDTYVVTRNMMSQLPIDQVTVPGLQDLLRRVDEMTLLLSRGDRAGRLMNNRLVRQMKSAGFDQVFATMRDGHLVRVLQSREDPSRAVMVVYRKPYATVVSMKGDFRGGFPQFFRED